MYPKSTFLYNKRTEAERILFTAHSLKNAFYHKNKFYVLPYLVPRNAKVIYFPRLAFEKIPNFWETIQRIPEAKLKYKPALITAVEQLLPDNSVESASIQAQWATLEKDFWQLVALLLPPRWFSGVSTIEIRPTAYCSIGSSYSERYKQTDKIIVYIRHDAAVSEIARTIFIDRLYRLPEMREYDWEQKMAMIDFIFKSTNVANLFPTYKSLLVSLRQNQLPSLAQESKEYLASLGFREEQIFTNTPTGIMIKGKQLLLTPQEKAVMLLLIQQHGHLVTFDEIAACIWGDTTDAKYSLYAMGKIIERLRHKIEKHSVFGDIILTKRGEGYMLLD